ncbi:beta-N-acetylhexosaminidase [Leifsonia sp. NPDC058248]|uniref:beta-N-acetylhexosaminidase n=1 Tax=Leifsonia sp. NPDC058248 TaxID=3346402 RepID=UPI0036DAD505
MPSLIPLPRRVDAGQGTFALRTGDAVVAPNDLLSLAQLFVRDVLVDTELGLRPAPVGEKGAIEIVIDGFGLEELPAPAGVRADGRGDADERYGLSVAADGIRVWSPTAEGIHRGLTSLRQLIAAATREDEVWAIPAVSIVDVPRFAWRGLSLDVARCFHPAETVRRVIDMCSLYKLNVLHLHLTDDQAWRIPISGWPELTPGQSEHYTNEELDELVAYAAARFVTVVPEADMPGHVSAVFTAYPALRTAPPVFESTAVPIGTLDPDHDLTWRFVEDVVTELAARFPTSAHLHLGGDEAFGMPDEAHARFVDRAARLVKERGRRVIGWQEISRADIGGDDIVQYWIDLGDLGGNLDSEGAMAMMPPEFMPVLFEMLAKAEGDTRRAIDKGASILVSPASRAYFDRPHAAASADPEQEERRARLGLPVYPAATLRDFIEWDPVDVTPGVDDEERLVGVEAAVWCETVRDRDDLEFLLLPRLPGAAETAWAERGATDWDDYAGRLADQSAVWHSRGWTWFQSSEIDWRPIAVTVG